jgi:preprotein translocase subunit SecB
MPSGSITAQFNFISYKVDSINMKMSPKIKYLLNNKPLMPQSINLSINLRNTEKFNLNGSIHYVGGLSTQITINDDENKEEMLSGQFDISGIFALVGDMEKLVEEDFAKINLPALLMPYLRATMTNILSTAGFGTVLFPLVNMYELAKKQNVSLIDHAAPTE